MEWKDGQNSSDRVKVFHSKACLMRIVLFYFLKKKMNNLFNKMNNLFNKVNIDSKRRKFIHPQVNASFRKITDILNTKKEQQSISIINR
jgi:hypothetical protein